MGEVTIRQLEYFVAAADIGTVTGAAQKLHLSQSALSMALSELERALGAQLLLRHRRGITPTRLGRQVLADARRLVSEVKDLENSAREGHRDMTGDLVVGCYSTLPPMILPPVVDAYVRSYPLINLSFVEGNQAELIDRLHQGLIDVAIVYDYGSAPLGDQRGVTARVIHRAPPYVLLPGGHPLAGAETVPLAELAGEPLVLFDLPPGGDYFRSVFAAHGYTPEVRFRSTNFELVRSLVARGLGYSLLSMRPKSLVSYEGLDVAVAELSDATPPLPICAVTPAGARPTRPTTAFIEQCARTWAGQPDAAQP